MNSKKQIKFFIIIPLFWGIIVSVYSCKQGDIEKINAITQELNLPSQAWEEVEMQYTKSGQTNIVVYANEANRYGDIEKPYMEFSQGLYVEFYDSLGAISSTIQSDYALFNEDENLWTARNNVEATNAEGDTLNTELLYWDMSIKKIYSDKYVKVISKDDIIHGNGFEAKQNFSNWKVKNITGTFNVNDESE